MIERLRATLRWLTRNRLRWLAACGALAAVGLLPVLVLPTNSDVAWLLFSTQQVLDGATLYVDLIEVNPPLIVWLSLPPVAVAELLEVRSRGPFLIYVFVLILLSLRITWRILGTLRPAPSVRRRRGYMLLLILVLVVLSGWVFGQREHLMTIFVVPYAVAVASRITGGEPSRPAVWGAGLLGGLGFALKPYYLPVWIGLEGYHWLVARRSVETNDSLDQPTVDASLCRPELAAALGIVLVYVAAVPLLAHEYLEMGRRLAPVYVGVRQATLGELLTHPVTLMSVFGLIALAVSDLTRPTAAIARVFGVVLAFWILGAIVQLKGWWYHFYPALAAGTVVIALIVVTHERRRESGLVGRLLPFVGLMVLGGAVGGRLGKTFTALHTGADFERRLPVTTEIVQQYVGKDGNLAVLSPFIHAAFPLVNRARVRWTLRFNSMWVPEIVYWDEITGDAPVRYNAPEQMALPERHFWESVLADLTDDPPDVLLLDEARLNAPGFDYRDYLGRDQRFRNLMRRCEPLGKLGRYQIYRCDAAGVGQGVP